MKGATDLYHTIKLLLYVIILVVSGVLIFMYF